MNLIVHYNYIYWNEMCLDYGRSYGMKLSTYQYGYTIVTSYDYEAVQEFKLLIMIHNCSLPL